MKLALPSLASPIGLVRGPLPPMTWCLPPSRVPAMPPAEIPLDPSSENYRWAPSVADRRMRIPTTRGLTGVLALTAAPPVTMKHFDGSAERPLIAPTAIVIHSTAFGVDLDAEGWKRFVEKNRGVGTQYFILKSGEIVELMPPDQGAWHVSARADNGRWNDSSVGIELVNGNTSPAGREPYTVKQIEALRLLTRALATRFDIPRDSIVMHRQLQPNNRTDPVGFPWHHFLRSLGNDRPWTGPIYQTGPDDPGVPRPRSDARRS